jgi:NADH-quinone oxidoreductase subunit A
VGTTCFRARKIGDTAYRGCYNPRRRRTVENMLANYAPILIFLIIAGAASVVLLLAGFALGRGRKDKDKLSPYECGFEAFEDSRMRFDVRYYLVAILFIIFDLEIAFLFPWAVSLDAIGTFGLVAMGIFLAVLVVGFVYEWRKGALEWD